MRRVVIHTTTTTTKRGHGGIVHTICGDRVYSCDTSGNLDQITCILCLDALQRIYHGEQERLEKKQNDCASRAATVRGRG